MKHFLNFFIALVTLTFFCACSELSDSTGTSLGNGVFVVSGSLSLGDCAAPSAFLCGEDESRSAITSFSGTSYNITATQASDSAIYTANVSGNNFAISLPRTGEWTFTATGFIGETPCLSGTKTLALSDTTDEIKITISPLSSDGSGSINLALSDETGKVSRALAHFSDESDESLSEQTLSFSDGTATLVIQEISVGSHSVTFTFYDESGAVLCLCDEVLSVFANSTTDTWAGNGLYLKRDDDGATHFVISEEAISAYQTKKSVISTPFVLWNKSTQEASAKIENGNVVESITKNAFVQGLQVFGELSEGMKITEPIAQNFKAFCFDDDKNLYTIEKYSETDGNLYLRKYISSYAGYKKDKDFGDVKLWELFENNGIFSSRFGGMEYHDGWLYVGDYGYSNGYFAVIKISSIGTESPVAMYCELNERGVFTVKENADSKDLYLATVSDYTPVLYHYTLTLSDDAISASKTASSLSLSYETLGVCNFTDYLYANEMYILEDTLYLLVSADGSYRGQCSLGGIIKLDVSSWTDDSAPSPQTWEATDENMAEKVFGWYNHADENGRYDNQPPLDSTNYFFCPYKIIGSRGTTLLIADDGGYVSTEFDESGRSAKSIVVQNKNRVVSFDIKTCTMTAIDVAAMFNAEFYISNWGSAYSAYCSRER